MSKAACAPPSEHAAMFSRPPLRPFIAMPKPVPSPSAPPSIASAGTRTPSRITWAVGWACQPIFSSSAPKLSPGVPFSMTKAEMPRGPGFRSAGACHHHVDVGCAGAGDELLDTVEHIIAPFALLDRTGAQRARIRARAGLGQAVAGDDVHRRQSRHPRLALLVGAEACRSSRRTCCGSTGKPPMVGSGDGQLLEDADPVEPAQPAAADVVAAVDRRHPELGGLAQHVDRESAWWRPIPGCAGRAAFRRTLPPSR